jgi:hypothetical protein
LGDLKLKLDAFQRRADPDIRGIQLRVSRHLEDLRSVGVCHDCSDLRRLNLDGIAGRENLTTTPTGILCGGRPIRELLRLLWGYFLVGCTLQNTY